MREGHAAALYDGADTGVDPQKLLATPDTPIYQVAQRSGLSFVGLYVYPPILADLLVPLTWFSLPLATQIWFALNVAFLIATAAMLALLLEIRLRSWHFAALLIAALCFTPALQCLVDGQITIFLLLLWSAGMSLYRRDRHVLAAAAFALAAAIKLTPVIVILPFLLWRKWKPSAIFAATLCLLATICLVCDTPGTARTYLLRVLPAMSGAIASSTNYSLPAATQRVVTLLRTGTIADRLPSLPATTVLAGRAASALALLLVLAALLRNRQREEPWTQLVTLGTFGLLAPVLSPVSWFHAYATSFAAFVILWYEAATLPVPLAYLLLLLLTTLGLGSPVAENVLSVLNQNPHTAPLGCVLTLAELLLAVALMVYRLSGPAAFSAHGRSATGGPLPC